MKGPWLLLDVSYLAYRAFFALGKLSHGEIPTTVCYGVIKDVLSLQETFATNRIAFAFDHGRSLRSLLLPGYKSSRHDNKTTEELHSLLAVKEQIRMLRTEYLTQVGYRNLLWEKGYEADDVIANVILERPDKDFVIVSSDHDLYQLLSPRVRVYNPYKKECVTEESFFEEFGCSPSAWPDIKALAGCSTDDIPGIPGVGEKTAAKWLNGNIPAKSKAYDRLVKGTELWKFNLQLVRLPFPGMQGFRLVKDEVTPTGWQSLIDRLGMNSLTASIDGIPRRSGPKIMRHKRTLR